MDRVEPSSQHRIHCLCCSSPNVSSMLLLSLTLLLTSESAHWPSPRAVTKKGSPSTPLNSGEDGNIGEWVTTGIRQAGIRC